MTKISLQNRKRTSEMSQEVEKINQTKKDELLALKLQSLNQAAETTGTLLQLALSEIQPDPNQPRKTFKNIDSLAKSIQEQGLLQPIVVKPYQNHYQIVVGERRFRAAQQVGLQKIPAIVREEEDADTVILQLLENDQREQVSPLEEAQALQKLIETMGLSKQQIAKELGRDSAWISLRIGLLNANAKIKNLILTEKISDLRTLHELRKLSEEDPALFENVLGKIEALQPNGGYRHLIRETRKAQADLAPLKILKAEYQEGALSLYVQGKRKPMIFAVDHSILKQLSLLTNK